MCCVGMCAGWGCVLGGMCAMCAIAKWGCVVLGLMHQKRNVHVHRTRNALVLHQPVREEDASAQKVVRLLLCDSFYPIQKFLVNSLAPKLP